jgi:Uma2 family endonuclease
MREMSMQIEPIVTVADLNAMPDDGNRYETINGELFVSKAPGITHQLVFGNLFLILSSYLTKRPVGQIVATPGLVLSRKDAVIPDLVFIRTERLAQVVSGERLIAAPELVIEILSPGNENRRRDRTVKRQLYGKFGVKEYWLVDPKKRTVETYVLEDQTLRLASTSGVSDNLTSTVLPGFHCPVSSIFDLNLPPATGVDRRSNGN